MSRRRGRKLMGEIFPEQEYRLNLLPPSHPVWRAEEPVDPDYVKELYGIDVGFRDPSGNPIEVKGFASMEGVFKG